MLAVRRFPEVFPGEVGAVVRLGGGPGAAVGCSRGLTFDIDEADLSKVEPLAQDGELRDAVLRHHGQPPLADEVHFTPHVAPAADKLAGAEDLGLQPQHQLLQHAVLPALEETDAAQGRQVDTGRHVGPQPPWQVPQHRPLRGQLPLRPQVLVPVSHPPRQPPAHALRPQVVSHRLGVRVEGGIGCVPVGDDGADAARDGGEAQHSQKEASGNEEELLLAPGLRCVTHCGEDEGGEVEAVEVLPQWVGEARAAGVGADPGIGAQPQPG